MSVAFDTLDHIILFKFSTGLQHTVPLVYLDMLSSWITLFPHTLHHTLHLHHNNITLGIIQRWQFKCGLASIMNFPFGVRIGLGEEAMPLPELNLSPSY